MMSFSATGMIETKRYNLRPHSEEELKWWMETYCSSSSSSSSSGSTIPDYQMSAWLMAVCWRGMTLEETGWFTKYMVQSGRQLEWNNNDNHYDNDTSQSPLPLLVHRADKHSSGGVGDKISLVLAPLVAAFGDSNINNNNNNNNDDDNHNHITIQVPMMAGRGLGHTGGTLDKLESIPGYQVSQTEDDFQRMVRTVGCSIVSTTEHMVLADRKLYALRDVTGTVSCIALQTASIASKKIAEHPDSLVLDIKYGRGSFQSTLEDAIELATSLIHTTEMNGISSTTAFCTRMDIPIGRAIGNWLEVKECLNMMMKKKNDDDDDDDDGIGSKRTTTTTTSDLRQLVLVEAAQMIRDSGNNKSMEEIIPMLDELLESGVVHTKFRDMVQAHGGDISVIDDPESYLSTINTINPSSSSSSSSSSNCNDNTPRPRALLLLQCDVLAPQDGHVSDMNALTMGQASMLLGAGREVAGQDDVDALAGLWLHKVVGESVTQGDVVVTLYTTSKSMQVLDDVKTRVERAIEYSTEPAIALRPPIISHMITRDGIQEFNMPRALK